MPKYVKIVVYVPKSHADLIREVFSASGCGHIGAYDYCSFSVKGFGRFRALKGAKPFVGKIGKIEKVKEERIETICSKIKLKKVIESLRNAHPYEEPVIDIYPLLNQ